jgi:hypothetical protein
MALGHRWIVDVLTDLRTYAYMNNLHVLAQELDACARVALDETAIPPDMPAAGVMDDGTATRDVSGTGGNRLWIG